MSVVKKGTFNKNRKIQVECRNKMRYYRGRSQVASAFLR